MKLKYKKYIYIVGYLFPLSLSAILSFTSYVKDWDIPFNIIFYPYIFVFIDGIISFIIMHNLKKEPYLLQVRVLNYFNGWNNLFLLLILFFGSRMSFIVTILNFFIHLVIYFILRPMPVNDEVVNGVEEFFNKYPEHSKHRFYNDTDEIKKEYNPLKKEIEVELPGMEVLVKDQQREKRKKIISLLVPLLIVIMVIVGVLFRLIENNVKFNRGNYHNFTLSLNGEEIPVYYEQEYNNVVIPFFYEQHNINDSTMVTNNSLNNILFNVVPQNRYLIDLEEYGCFDDDTNVPCTANNINTKRKISLSRSTMIIKKSTKPLDEDFYNIIIHDENMEIVYEGDYREDITEYLVDEGTYVLIFNNNGNNIKNEITAIINITSEERMT